LDFGFWILDFGFWILDFGFWILDFGLQIADCRLQIAGLRSIANRQSQMPLVGRLDFRIRVSGVLSQELC
jgi:hypothetical protein